ncbi:MAG TPA: dihydrodipicolinate synthase family protein [Beijerinckiaceae bacterium]|nr:dihydrodipicolinate synthase family protein [Beijerinckiaceae bacterium]
MQATDLLHPVCQRLTGIVPSQNTPFTADGAVDAPAVRRLARASLRAGVAGLLILAVASENRALTIDERARIGALFMEEIAGAIPVVVAVSAPDIDTAVILTRQAVAIKADAVCYQAPAGLSRNALADQLARIADCGPRLIMLQDLDFNGPGLSVEDIAWLYERQPLFRAIKVETQPAGPKYSDLLARFGGALHVSGGWAVMQMIEALERGVHAFMPTAMDNIYVAIHRLFAAGRKDEARSLFERLLPFVAFSNQHIDVSIRFFKRLRLLDGTFSTDHCRPPTPMLDPYQQATLNLLARRAVALDGEMGG